MTKLIGTAKPRKAVLAPFHVVSKAHNGVHVGYDIYVNNQKFLISADSRFPLKRFEAYAICRLLNSQTRSRKWTQKFGGCSVV